VSRRQVKTVRVLLVAHGWNIDIGVELNGSDLVRPFSGARNGSGGEGSHVHAVGS
jgi:hypothetical protein